MDGLPLARLTAIGMSTGELQKLERLYTLAQPLERAAMREFFASKVEQDLSEWLEVQREVGHFTVPPSAGPITEDEQAMLDLISAFIPMSQKGEAGGVGTLDETGRQPISQSPLSVVSSSLMIDLCRQPYNAAPEEDITSKLQAAIAAIAGTKTGGVIYFSKAGTYLIHGPQQAGAAYNYTYSGQILFPATAGRSEEFSITIKGLARANSSNDADSQGVSGVVLESNATTGSVFDCVPGFEAFGAPNGWTGVQPVFEDIVVTTPTNPQCSAIKAITALRFYANNLTINTTASPTAELTGQGHALYLPQMQNSGDLILDDIQITGYPNGLGMSEHANLRGVYIGRCINAVTGHGGGHANILSYLDVEECVNIFTVSASDSGTLKLWGFLDWENVLTTGPFVQAALVNEWANGEIRGVIFMMTEGSQIKGFPMSGAAAGPGRGLDVVNILQGSPGWKGRHPSDSMERQAPTTGTNPGSSSPTQHPWRVQTGKLKVEAGKLKGLEAAGGNRAFLPARNGGESRTVTATVELAASEPWVELAVQAPVNSSGSVPNSGRQCISVKLEHSGNVKVYVNNVEVGTAGAFVAGSTYKLAVAVAYNALNEPTSFQVYVNGAEKFSYTLTEEQRELLTPASSAIFPFAEDGVVIWDTTSAVTSFAVTPYTSKGEKGNTGAGVIAPSIVTATNAALAIPEGAGHALITCVGGGGGGGGAGSPSSTQLQVGGSGGSAGVSQTQLVALGSNTTLNVTIGAGGAGGAGGAAGGHEGSNGIEGGSTTVTGTGISVYGGQGTHGTKSGASATTQVNSVVFGAGPFTSPAGVAQGGTSANPGGAPIDGTGGGGGGGGTATTTNGGEGGKKGTIYARGQAGANGGSATAEGGEGESAPANSGAGGGGGGAGAAGIGAGGKGGNGGSGLVTIVWLP